MAYILDLPVQVLKNIFALCELNDAIPLTCKTFYNLYCEVVATYPVCVSYTKLSQIPPYYASCYWLQTSTDVLPYTRAQCELIASARILELETRESLPERGINPDIEVLSLTRPQIIDFSIFNSLHQLTLTNITRGATFAYMPALRDITLRASNGAYKRQFIISDCLQLRSITAVARLNVINCPRVKIVNLRDVSRQYVRTYKGYIGFDTISAQNVKTATMSSVAIYDICKFPMVEVFNIVDTFPNTAQWHSRGMTHLKLPPYVHTVNFSRITCSWIFNVFEIYKLTHLKALTFSKCNYITPRISNETLRTPIRIETLTIENFRCCHYYNRFYLPPNCHMAHCI